MAVRADPGPFGRVPVLPDPAHGPRLSSRPRRHQAAVAGGNRESRRQHLALLEVRGRAHPVPGVPRRHTLAVRPRVLRLRHRQCSDQPGGADAGTTDQQRHQQRGGRRGARLRQGDRRPDDRHRHGGHHPLFAAPGEDFTMAVARRGVHRTRWMRLQAFRYVVFLFAAIFFLVPIGSMLEFSTRGNTGERTLDYWKSIVTFPDMIGTVGAPGQATGIVASLELALITSVAMLVLLVPTMVWVRLKLKRLNRIVEFICLLPLTIPRSEERRVGKELGARRWQ